MFGKQKKKSEVAESQGMRRKGVEGKVSRAQVAGGLMG